MLLLCGATGLLGGRIAEKLRERDVPLRALLRPASDGSRLEALGVEIVRGDLRDRASLGPAVEGVETVVTTVTRIGRLLAGAEKGSLDEVDRTGNENLVEAAERAGVARFVFVSAAGMAADPKLPLARSKLAVEERLRRSPLREVIVRPDLFQEVWISPAAQLDWANGKLNVLGKGETPARYVSVEDVAEAVVRLALADDPPREIELGGPEALTRKEVCDRIEEAAGRPMKRRHLPRPALAVARRALAPVRPGLASLLGLGYVADTRTVTLDDRGFRELGIEPKPASAYIREAVAQR